jgi:hypothetical protein
MSKKRPNLLEIPKEDAENIVEFGSGRTERRGRRPLDKSFRHTSSI